MKKKQCRNLFGLPSVLFAVLTTAVFTAQPAMDSYFKDGSFEPRALQKVAYMTLISLLGSSAARYAESEGDDIYTPTRFIPGRTKIDALAQQNSEYIEDDGIL